VSVTHHILRTQVRIETIAENHSVPGSVGLSLDETLAGLDFVGRRRVAMLLEKILAFSEDADEKAAAEHIQTRAARVWRTERVGVARQDQHKPRD
jgi:hypothetical protein